MQELWKPIYTKMLSKTCQQHQIHIVCEACYRKYVNRNSDLISISVIIVTDVLLLLPIWKLMCKFFFFSQKRGTRDFARQITLEVNRINFKWKMARIPCPTCGQVLGTNYALRRHNQTIHLNQRNFTCDACGESFAQQVQLQRHFRRNHEDVEIRCNQCPRTFATQENLRRHVQSVHEGRRRFKCIDCDITFRQLSDLYRWETFPLCM